ncbi:hypothetical protein [uncultured Exiguobacterium sp.]|uniref:hypothetical protein n=1 Tax=uncultured Exiguobacterium sp. TaxID=202669 RepID=UPI0025E33157|nr:hypothetical protein [uncultured Exiguobacterium sp.]
MLSPVNEREEQTGRRERRKQRKVDIGCVTIIGIPLLFIVPLLLILLILMKSAP